MGLRVIRAFAREEFQEERFCRDKMKSMLPIQSSV